MEILLKQFKKTFISNNYACYAEIDNDKWKEASSTGMSLKDFVYVHGVEKIHYDVQNVPDTYIGIEKGWSVRLRLSQN